MNDMHDVPFAALGRVDGAEDEVILLQAGRAGQVGGGGRRVDRQLSDEPASRAVTARDLFELLDVAQADGRVLIPVLEDRFVEPADAFDLHSRGRLAGPWARAVVRIFRAGRRFGGVRWRERSTGISS